MKEKLTKVLDITVLSLASVAALMGHTDLGVAGITLYLLNKEIIKESK